MARKNPAPKRKNRQPYSIGSLVIMALLVLAYWWMTGSLPGSEEQPAGAPVADRPTLAETVAPAALPVETPVEATAESATEESSAGTPTAPDDSGEAGNRVDERAAEVAVAPANPPTPTPPNTATAPATATTPPRPTASATNPPRAGPPGIPAINYDKLPREALETLILIAEGGPFPFDRDGITFQNRERLLPDRPRGYYAEYTVITPGASTRGARRIVAGQEGELYYTDDHYESFYWIVLP